MTFRFDRTAVVAILLVGLAAAAPASGGDWPMWRYDALRSACSPEALPESMTLQWTLALASPKACWPANQWKEQFDVSYEPIVAGGRLIVPSMVRDSVTAYETATGREAWRFYTDGPVRFAPAAWRDRVFVASDDGYLYCLALADGSLHWKFKGAPLSHWRLLANGRLASMYPVRGAPVVRDNVVYFAAGVWPFLGTFIHALDAATGKVVWTNSGSGAIYILQPHSAPSFAGVAPQGYLVAAKDHLIVPGGRAVPAAYERATGKFLWHNANTHAGCFDVWANEQFLFNDGRAGFLGDGKDQARSGATVLTPAAMLGVSRDKVTAQSYRLTGGGAKGKDFAPAWQAEAGGAIGRVYLTAGGKLYGANGSTVAAMDLEGTHAITWRAKVEGTVWTMLAADGKLFVVTREGGIHCFAAGKGEAAVLASKPVTPAAVKDEWTAKAGDILKAAKASEGWGVVLGLGSGRLVEELLGQSSLALVVLEPDAAKANAARRAYDAAGLYGGRVHVVVGDLATLKMPAYLAALVTTEDSLAAGLDKPETAAKAVGILRPYGGALCVDGTVGAGEGVEPARVVALTVVRRGGALPGAGSWGHQYGDVGNSVFSTDRLAKAPLGMLWFGGEDHMDVLPRHGHGPAPQVVGGRLIIEGPDALQARDVYTGRLIWKRKFAKELLNTFEMYYNASFNPDPRERGYNQGHFPGANWYGSNHVTTPDKVYLANQGLCHVLDAATGKTLREFSLPEENGQRPNWGYIGVSGETLLATAEPVRVDLPKPPKPAKPGKAAPAPAPEPPYTGPPIESLEKAPGVQANQRFAPASRTLVAMDRHTGKVRWSRQAAYSFRHNAVVAGAGKVFCIDRIGDAELAYLTRRGLKAPGKATLYALSLEDGKVVWKTDVDVFGTWLGYSAEHDVLLQGGSAAGDRGYDEAGAGMTAYKAASGQPIWHRDDKYAGPPVLHHEMILTQTGGGDRASSPAAVFSLLTGKPLVRKHPMTGQEIPWNWIRFKGCNTAIASEHLMTFRSGAASFVPLDVSQGTASIGGFKSGCTSNLIAADGVLNAPDYTRTCTCSYQLQTSLALVHMPELEYWSLDYFPPASAPTPVRRVGVNLGAPGNRTSDDGTLWLEAPSVGGPSPDLPVRFSGAQAGWFRAHNTTVAGPLNWVAASGLEGAGQLLVRPFLQPEKPTKDVMAFWRNATTTDLPFNGAAGSFNAPRPYTVRLVFAEPTDAPAGTRVFTVALQGRDVLTDLDVSAAAGGPRRSLIKEFKGVNITDDLKIDLKPVKGQPILCGVELIAE